MITIDYKLLTVFDACYLLSNNEGHMDGDAKCLVLE